jgi:Zn-finger in ubiquitin-hydrolases and other protein
LKTNKGEPSKSPQKCTFLKKKRKACFPKLANGADGEPFIAIVGFSVLSVPSVVNPFWATANWDIKIKEAQMAATQCTHLNQIRPVKPSAKGCEECLKTGDTWVHLRMCEICGHVGCCDSSKNKHATKHFHRTKHPIIRSIEPGENWQWCYVDEIFIE